jgi:hypothetical protein
MGYLDIEPRDALRLFISETEVARTRMAAAQKALGDSFLGVHPGYQDISAQISSALAQSVAALEEARRKLEQLEPKSFRE